MVHPKKKWQEPKARRKPSRAPTRVDVAEALRAFKKGGGLIQTLKPQLDLPRRSIGVSASGLYEDISSGASFVSAT